MRRLRAHRQRAQPVAAVIGGIIRIQRLAHQIGVFALTDPSSGRWRPPCLLAASEWPMVCRVPASLQIETSTLLQSSALRQHSAARALPSIAITICQDFTARIGVDLFPAPLARPRRYDWAGGLEKDHFRCSGRIHSASPVGADQRIAIGIAPAPNLAR